MPTTPTPTALRLAVHLHIYYTDMWPQLQGYLAHLEPRPYHLYVTLTQESPELEAQIRAYHADTTVYIVENRGYDIGPFVYFLQRINLSDYDLILKLHTKNSVARQLIRLNYRIVTRAWWAWLLYTSLLGSRRRVQQHLDTFCREPQVGMVGSRYLITSHKRDFCRVKEGLQAAMGKMGYTRWDSRFVSGSMFMVRSSILQPVQQHFAPEDFEPTARSMEDGTLAHVLERVFGCLTTAQGYRIKGCGWSLRFELSSLVEVIKDFLYKKRVTTSNRLIIKICRIPIINRSLPR